ncbi:hypothetical protein PR048_012740 [Dryococelus australis]|uniref:Uncharacterized protein n=1 Tax=Dryococelus australis TaxID=614101 RepID=A0ABQ9HQ78_9NEOP|nr:hypothetical protein PR048_012740 [Dryococelus australis]
MDGRLRARQARPKSIVQLMEWLQEEWRRILVDALQTLVESMPDRAVLNNDILIIDEGETRWIWISAGLQWRRKWDIPEETCRPVALSGTNLTCQESNPVRLGRGGVEVTLLAFRQGEPRSSPDGNAPGFSHVATVLRNVTSRRVFSKTSCHPCPLSGFHPPSIPVALHTHLASYSLALKRGLREDLSTIQEWMDGVCFAKDYMHSWRHGGVMVRQLASHLGEPGSISGGVAPRFLHTGIVPNDDAIRRVFSGMSRFLQPGIPVLLHLHLTSPSKSLKTLVLTGNRFLHSTLHYMQAFLCR